MHLLRHRARLQITCSVIARSDAIIRYCTIVGVSQTTRSHNMKHVCACVSFLIFDLTAVVIVRPFLIQSDSASRKRPFRLDFFSDWILLVLLLRQSSRFYSFVLFLEAVGVREYCCTAGEIGWQVCASRFLREQRLDESSSQRVGGFGLSRKPPKLRSWSCTQPRAAKATAGAAVVAAWDRDRALLPSCDTRCWRAELGMRHADFLRQATAGIAKPASAPCIITAVWYLVWVCGRVAVWVCFSW